MSFRIIAILVLLCSAAFGQLPGDFNCSGVVNGVDLVYLQNMYRYGISDTGNCCWYNGDLNADSLFHTVADIRQFFRLMHGDTSGNNPPLPFDLDTISVGSSNAIPGEMVSLPIKITIPERIYDSMIHIRFDTTWLESWMLVESGHGEVGYYRGGEYFWLMGFEPDGLESGSYSIGNLILTISPNCPAGTEIPIMLVAGDYYPSGFANDSYPTYFISPILDDGFVHVIPSGIDGNEVPELPRDYLIAYPNPFNSSVKIRLVNSDLVSDQTVSIFDIAGRQVRILTMAKRAGEVVWNGCDDSGESVNSGVYFAKIIGSDRVLTAKLTLLK